MQNIKKNINGLRHSEKRYSISVTGVPEGEERENEEESIYQAVTFPNF